MTANFWLTLLVLGLTLVTGAAANLYLIGDESIKQQMTRNPLWYWWPNQAYPRYWRSYLCARLGGLMLLTVFSRFVAYQGF